MNSYLDFSEVKTSIIMEGVRDYDNGNVLLETRELENGEERYIIVAFNQCGYDATLVDLIDVLDWVKKHKPELI